MKTINIFGVILIIGMLLYTPVHNEYMRQQQAEVAHREKVEKCVKEFSPTRLGMSEWNTYYKEHPVVIASAGYSDGDTILACDMIDGDTPAPSNQFNWSLDSMTRLTR